MRQEVMKQEVICDHCGKKFKRWKSRRPAALLARDGWNIKHEFCSKKCNYEYNYKHKVVHKPCAWCGKEVDRKLGQYKRSKIGNVFCNNSCSASYNNTQRRKSRRSKMEIMLFEMIKEEFPNLEIIPNDKELLGGYEVDIAIPSINFAIEWNGIVHFKPIYGQKKLDNIQQRDLEKKKLAEEKQIELAVIPDLVSTKKYVVEVFQEIKKRIKQLAM